MCAKARTANEKALAEQKGKGNGKGAGDKSTNDMFKQLQSQISELSKNVNNQGNA